MSRLLIGGGHSQLRGLCCLKFIINEVLVEPLSVEKRHSLRSQLLQIYLPLLRNIVKYFVLQDTPYVLPKEFFTGGKKKRNRSSHSLIQFAAIECV